MRVCVLKTSKDLTLNVDSWKKLQSIKKKRNCHRFFSWFWLFNFCPDFFTVFQSIFYFAWCSMCLLTLIKKWPMKCTLHQVVKSIMHYRAQLGYQTPARYTPGGKSFETHEGRLELWFWKTYDFCIFACVINVFLNRTSFSNCWNRTAISHHNTEFHQNFTKTAPKALLRLPRD